MAASAPERYFAQCQQAFEQAASRHGLSERFFRLGPQTWCLQCAGDALASRICPALAHLEVPSAASPSLTVLCWDSASTETSLPSPPWSNSDYGARGHVIGFNRNGMRAAYNHGILNLFDTSQRTGIYWMHDASTISAWERCCPLRTLLNWWTHGTPYQLVHAAAIGTSKAGLLLTGKSGSGKSTTALACLQAGLRYAGDDYVMITSHPTPQAYSLYGTGKIAQESVGMLDGMQDKVSNQQSAASEKAVIFLQSWYASTLAHQLPIKAIFLPQVTSSRDTSLTAASAVETLMAMAPTTLASLDGDGKAMFQKIKEMVQSLPTYKLSLGSDLQQVARVIREYLES